jgi:adenylate cyclase
MNLIDKLTTGFLSIGDLFRRPSEIIEEDKVFLFLDINSSTESAERLGNREYSRYLNLFFEQVEDAAYNCSGEIYECVGDEVVISWEKNDAYNQQNCIRCFFMIKDYVAAHKSRYIREFGQTPGFKGSIHGGKVMPTTPLIYREKPVYHGQVLNVTSRLQELCYQYSQELIVSLNVWEKIPVNKSYKALAIGLVKIRGSAFPIEIFGVKSA